MRTPHHEDVPLLKQRRIGEISFECGQIAYCDVDVAFCQACKGIFMLQEGSAQLRSWSFAVKSLEDAREANNLTHITCANSKCASYCRRGKYFALRCCPPDGFQGVKKGRGNA